MIVLLRGVNVGGHRAFRPKLLAEELREFDVVNVGAAGTFVVRRPVARARLESALRSRLPANARWVICEGRELLALKTTILRGAPRAGGALIRFVSFLAKPCRARPRLPHSIPASQDWFVRVTTATDRIAVGDYRRHMKSIGYLGELDALFGTLVTTRSLATITTVVRLLESGDTPRPKRRPAATPKRGPGEAPPEFR